MSENRRASATVQTLVVLGAVSLLLPATPARAGEEGAWLRQDLASADRIGLVLDSGALRLDPGDPAGGASRRGGGGAGARAGLAVFPDQPLEERTDTVDVRVRADGSVEDILAETRGVRPDGMWTEWHPAAGGGRVALPEHVSRVQIRVGIEGSGAALTGLDVRPVEPVQEEPGAGGRRDGPHGEDGKEGSDEARKPFSARLFTTRIGLVGERTANGHVVRPDDHFAALPSRRGLATRGGGEYTVRVCTTGALGPEARGGTDGHDPRCAYLPVWDVGPWNITDDHWNEDRESWRDLDRGRPQAQAAYAEGYNEGLDGFGRRVRNPAGIDLADGAFRDGLRLPTNGWVRVDYLWTGEYRHRAEITTATQSDPVVVRGGPGTDHDPVGLAAYKANVDVACQAAGNEASGPLGTDDAWFRIGGAHYVPAVFADGGADAPACGLEP